jgi:hypothetical protein
MRFDPSRVPSPASLSSSRTPANACERAADVIFPLHRVFRSDDNDNYFDKFQNILSITNKCQGSDHDRDRRVVQISLLSLQGSSKASKTTILLIRPKFESIFHLAKRERMTTR